jgi:hypothetical protein
MANRDHRKCVAKKINSFAEFRAARSQISAAMLSFFTATLALHVGMPVARVPVRMSPVVSQAASTSVSLDDKTVTLAPYFKLKDAERFKQIWQEDYKKFAHKEDCVHYSFGFTDDGRAHCREAYTSAETVLQHLADVDGPLNAVLDGPAELERLEVHGPKEEIDKLIEPLTPFGCKFFVTEWGFRPSKSAMEFDSVCHLCASACIWIPPPMLGRMPCLACLACLACPACPGLPSPALACLRLPRLPSPASHQPLA